MNNKKIQKKDKDGREKNNEEIEGKIRIKESFNI